ncbi:MAG: sugar phosphate isomerase/epimerase [Clostridia bacterium]|nr:sugar phosphate isomerase/epimerase [Clostridia bacterium]
MDLSVNSAKLFADLGVSAAAKAAKAAGFSAFDYYITLDDTDSPLHGEDYRSVVSQIRRATENEGMRFNQTHAPFRFPVKKWDEPETFDLFVRSLEITALLGAKICVVHPLHHMEYLGHEEEIFRLNMDYFRKLIPCCREYGVRIGVENMWQTHRIRKNISFDTCSTIREFIRYLDTLDSESVVACLDVGHVVLPDGPDGPADFIRALGHDRLKALHIHDNDYTRDAHLLPYQGKLDWESITAALGEIDYTGDFTYEIGAVPFSVPGELIGDALRYAGAVGRYLVGKVEEHRKNTRA